MKIDLGNRSYEIVIERNCLERGAGILDLDRKCMIVTDDGVPHVYAEKIARQCREPFTFRVPAGEGSKSLHSLEKILLEMMNAGFTRKDCVIAVGGGMPGDLAGFAAATYMRGIDFYNIPTTILSQADSSIGGKTAVNLGGVKNIAGAFWQPRGVLIDPETLNTLPARQAAAGMAEIVKAGLIADADLFRYIEDNCSSGIDTDRVIAAAIEVKRAVVEADERESGLRRILNFGHTIGHGIESVTGLLHGECVAVGMLPMAGDDVRARLSRVLQCLNLPLNAACDPGKVFDAVMHDKKIEGGIVRAVYVPYPGKAEIISITADDLCSRIGSICH